MWFDPPSSKKPERDDERMREIERETGEFELSMIDRWLEFADQALKADKQKKKVEADDRSLEVA